MKPEDGADIGIIIRMMLSRPFRLVTPTVDGDVLAVLARADAAFTPPQVRDLIDMRSVEGVRNALRRLTAQGIVTRERYGNAYVYRLNRAHVAARHIIGLAESGDEVLQRMREQLATWSVPCEFAALFGSAATGAMTEESDIDVLVVRPDSVDVEADSSWHEQLAEFEQTSTSWTGNDTRVLELSAAEVATGVKRERVLRDIARDGIALSGPSDYLTRYRLQPRTSKGKR
jgi:predicted nucleotidyltransferase